MSKKKIAWVTDSTAFVTKELQEHPDVHVIPLYITFGEEQFQDGVELTTDELYTRIRENKELPKTSQPPAGEFAEMYEKLKENYDEAIAVHVSSEISGTIASSTQGKDMADFPVTVVDSLSMSHAITTLIEKGLELEKTGKSASEIGEILQTEAKKSENYVLLGSLDQFYKGGRMSGTQYLIGNLLKVKPIIQINNEGKFHLFQKVRSEKKATKRLIELFKEAMDQYKIDSVQIMHGNVEHRAEEVKALVHEQFPEMKVIIGEISSTIAAHAGEGTVAMIWHNENKPV
ncbi:DegV family protein [Salisediminibacterium selenitireducens]|uniref:DegV family protein n=1 Tax=Bacillus selenitireducens (strain ATCC 700615 / DSM 15326 / MLS10) TaxID=439292 RepID=D6XWT8_BACIE|nr:DegV family protein [Salisediminibacterium selenitireducens]ADH99914.1 degV family protein [[Bacillus] selenitireducens MLS10]